MSGVCRQYIHCLDLAEEVMLKGFFKVFSNLDSFKNKGSFEGWMRRIMVNECISQLRTDRKFQFVQDKEIENTSEYAIEIDTQLEVDEIQQIGRASCRERV